MPKNDRYAKSGDHRQTVDFTGTATLKMLVVNQSSPEPTVGRAIHSEGGSKKLI